MLAIWFFTPNLEIFNGATNGLGFKKSGVLKTLDESAITNYYIKKRKLLKICIYLV